ncbi:hypothetical protein LJD22_16595 [Bacillus velezensis]|nr:hypothetical protein [Bacillus velezensis]
MKFKKVLTGSALSLALLMSAAPAFAASPTASPSVENSPISTKADAGINAIKPVPSPNGIFAASFELNGTTWRLNTQQTPQPSAPTERVNLVAGTRDRASSNT